MLSAPFPRHSLAFPFLAVLVCGVLAGHSASAQVAPPAERPGDERPELPDFRSGRPFVLPPPPVPVAPPALPGGPSVVLRELILSGNTALPADTLREAAAPFIGRPADAAALETLRRALTDAYVRHGYITSGVVLPDQTVSDGVVRMTVVEGRLTEVRPSGMERLAPAYVVRRIDRDEEPLQIDRLRDRVEVLLLDPMVEKVDARLVPGERPGESRLDVTVGEAPMLGGGMIVSNDRSPATGGTEVRGDGVIRNVTGWGDQTWLRAARTEAGGLTDLGVAFEMPLTAADTRVRLAYDHTRSRVVEEPFSILDLESETSTLELGVSHPLYRTAAEDLTIGLSITKRTNKNWLLGDAFSFGSEATNGVTRVTVLRATQSYTSRGTDRVIAARSVISRGIGALNASTTPGTSDSRFTAWLGQAQVAQRLTDGGTQILLRADAQFANDPLPPIEQYALGGQTTVRGYRENLLVRDNAVIASAELRVPIARLALSERGGPSTGTVQAAAFVDWGRGFNTDRATPTPGSIASVGVGLLWSPTAWAQAQLYYGHALREVDTGRDEDIQDQGIHFRIALSGW